MKAIKYQSPVVPVERSMSDMMHVLGLAVTGGKYGTIRMFKEQIIRLPPAISPLSVLALREAIATSSTAD